MDKSRFGDAAAGTLIDMGGDGVAFVPSPLPPELQLGDVQDALTEATFALGELRGACRRLANPYILISPLQRREALTSSAMEGTYTQEDDLVIAEAGGEPVRSAETQEVLNYILAVREASEALTSLPISHRMILGMHRTLMSGMSADRGGRVRPGEYKRDQNMIGGRTTVTARFVPPPPDASRDCMDALERYLNRPEKTAAEAILDLALVHYQFETIHPFADGNGRVGRMLVTLMSVADGLLDMPVLYVSPSLEGEKDRYIDLMFDVSANGRWSAWVDFFLRKVADSCRATVETIDRLLRLQTELQDLVRESARSANDAVLVEMLFEQPVVTINNVRDRLGSSYQTARNAVLRLVELGVLVELRERQPHLYIAPRIYRVASREG